MLHVMRDIGCLFPGSGRTTSSGRLARDIGYRSVSEVSTLRSLWPAAKIGSWLTASCRSCFSPVRPG